VSRYGSGMTPSYVRLLADGRLRGLAAGDLVSSIGDGMAVVDVPWLVLQLAQAEHVSEGVAVVAAATAFTLFGLPLALAVRARRRAAPARRSPAPPRSWPAPATAGPARCSPAPAALAGAGVRRQDTLTVLEEAPTTRWRCSLTAWRCSAGWVRGAGRVWLACPSPELLVLLPA
jgi:hypothetical protein